MVWATPDRLAHSMEMKETPVIDEKSLARFQEIFGFKPEYGDLYVFEGKIVLSKINELRNECEKQSSFLSAILNEKYSTPEQMLIAHKNAAMAYSKVKTAREKSFEAVKLAGQAGYGHTVREIPKSGTSHQAG